MGLGVPDAGPILSRLSSSIIRPTMDGTGERPLPQADTTTIITIITTSIITIVIITKNIIMVADASCDAASYNAPDSNAVKCSEHMYLYVSLQWSHV